MGSHPLQLTIINDSRAEVCPGCKGGSMTAEHLQFIVEQLGHAYGDQVQVQVIDLAQTANQHWQQVVDKAREQGAALPLLAVNGVPRLWGKFDYRMAAEVIAVQREIEVGYRL